MRPGVIIENPKRRSAIRTGSAGWFNYYAGFSPSFAKALLESSGLNRAAVVVDPWNGSGTTTEIASVLGFKTYGFDLNPVMLVIAKARMLNRREKPSIEPITQKLIDSAASQQPKMSDVDPLSQWFTNSSAASFRKLESAIQELLVDATGYTPLGNRDLSNELSDIAAFFYNALFQTTRKVLRPFLGSNPTWVKKAKNDKEKISIDLRSILPAFRRQVKGMLAAIDDDLFSHLQNDNCYLDVAPSCKIPLERNSVDMILSSPPYCTRIDYAIATLPELAILGFSRQELRNLREKLIGTSTISKGQPTLSAEWGRNCNMLLKKIKQHTSKASATYYYKNHIQYFGGMFDSLAECQRILKPDGHCVLVVQDSYYKDVHNNLPRIILEMAESQKMILQEKVDFRQKRTMAGVHPGVKDYRKDFGATESVLVFSRAA